MNTAAIAVHGGISHRRPTRKQIRWLRESVQIGYETLKKTGSSVDAVEAAIKILEDCPFFNAGKGSAFTIDGTNELHASIMDGKTALSGAVAAVQLVRNPISLAKIIMLSSPNNFLCDEGAEEFARIKNERMEAAEYFITDEQYRNWSDIKRTGTANQNLSHHGTVGAVAINKYGEIAAGTSTGGLMNALSHRVSDSAIIGAGTYANNFCGVSCTGDGEIFIRTVAGKTIACLMEFGNKSLSDASMDMLDQLNQFKYDAGILSIDRKQNIVVVTNVGYMCSAYIKNNGVTCITGI